MANESPARRILQWLMPSNADVILISTMGRSKRNGLLIASEDETGKRSQESSYQRRIWSYNILNDSHKCLLLTQSPAICYRNDEEPDVHCTANTASGETH